MREQSVVLRHFGNLMLELSLYNPDPTVSVGYRPSLLRCCGRLLWQQSCSNRQWRAVSIVCRSALLSLSTPAGVHTQFIIHWISTSNTNIWECAQTQTPHFFPVDIVSKLYVASSLFCKPIIVCWRKKAIEIMSLVHHRLTSFHRELNVVAFVTIIVFQSKICFV